MTTSKVTNLLTVQALSEFMCVISLAICTRHGHQDCGRALQTKIDMLMEGRTDPCSQPWAET